MPKSELGFLHGLSKEDEFLAGNIADKVQAASFKGRSSFTCFLSEGRAELAKKVAAAYSFDRYMLFGGYGGAERVMLGLFADHDDPDENAFPIFAYTISYRRQDGLSHRDILGAMMGLGITRDSIGDILVSDDHAVMFLNETAAKMAEQQLAKIGRAGVKLEKGFDEDSLPQRSFKDISGTVPSLRADCIIALAVRCSRTKAEQLITSGAVSVKGEELLSGAKKLSEGDTFTIRGSGKFILDKIGGNTKKDRIYIDLKKFV